MYLTCATNPLLPTISTNTPGINKVSEAVLKLLMSTPNISKIHGISEIITTLRRFGLGCIVLIFAYIGLKLLLPSRNRGKLIDFKDVIYRTICAVLLSFFAVEIVDIIINLSNAMSSELINKFGISLSQIHRSTPKALGLLIAVVVFLIQIYFTVKVAIGYWIRMIGLVFLTIISPIISVLWINPAWSGFLTNWFRKVTTLAFTQFTQILILLIYTLLLHASFAKDPIAGLFLGIGAFYFMSEAPKYLGEFMDRGSADVNFGTITRPIRSTYRKVNKTRNFINRIRPIKKKVR